jgi:hypothetical protein
MIRNCNPWKLPEDTLTWEISSPFDGRGFITLRITYLNGDTTTSRACSAITIHADSSIEYNFDLLA